MNPLKCFDISLTSSVKTDAATFEINMANHSLDITKK